MFDKGLEGLLQSRRPSLKFFDLFIGNLEELDVTHLLIPSQKI